MPKSNAKKTLGFALVVASVTALVFIGASALSSHAVPATHVAAAHELSSHDSSAVSRSLTVQQVFLNGHPCLRCLITHANEI
jgi:hypothetical protein